MKPWLAIAFAVGIGLGLLFGWVVWPVQYYDTVPSQLRADYKREYIYLTALTYEVEGDLEAAETRLRRLGADEAVAPVVELVEQLISRQAPTATIAPLARLAHDLDVDTPIMAPYLQGEFQ
mgnify:CR=1 FL=1